MNEAFAIQGYSTTNQLLCVVYAECCCELNRRLDGIECSMLKRPNLYGVAATCTGQVIPNGALGALGTGTVLA